MWDSQVKSKKLKKKNLNACFVFGDIGEIVSLKTKEKSLNEKRRAALNKLLDIKGDLDLMFCNQYIYIYIICLLLLLPLCFMTNYFEICRLH